MKLKRKMFLCGKMVAVRRCDCCGEESDGTKGGLPDVLYWKKQDFSLCLRCLEMLAQKYILRLK